MIFSPYLFESMLPAAEVSEEEAPFAHSETTGFLAFGVVDEVFFRQVLLLKCTWRWFHVLRYTHGEQKQSLANGILMHRTCRYAKKNATLRLFYLIYLPAYRPTLITYIIPY